MKHNNNEGLISETHRRGGFCDLCRRPSMTIQNTYRCQNIAVSSRRNVLNKVGSAFVGAGLLAAVPTNPALAIQACPPGSKNCIRTTWTPPAGMSKSVVAETLRAVIKSYPQEGQNGVDCNGWTIVVDELDGPVSKARVEFRSCVGFFAKLVNAGQPFIDDLELEVGDGGTVQVRSSSRIGESDLGVNKKRLDYLGDALRAKGWGVPPANY